MGSSLTTKKIGIIIGILIVGITAIYLVTNYNIKETPTATTTLRVGYLGIVDSVPVFSSINQGYFSSDGFNITSTKFQSSNDLLQALVNGNIDCAAGVSSQAVFALEAKSPGIVKVIADITHPSNSPFSAVLVKNDSSLKLSDLSGKKIAVFPGATSITLSDISFKKLLGSDFKATYVQMPPNLWLTALASGQVDAVVTYEPFGTLGVDQQVSKTLYKGLYEKFVMDNAPTAFVLVEKNFADKNPQIISKIQDVIAKGKSFVQSNEHQAREISISYIVIPESVALKMYLQNMYIGNDMNMTAIQQYSDILFEAGAFDHKIDTSDLIYRVVNP